MFRSLFFHFGCIIGLLVATFKLNEGFFVQIQQLNHYNQRIIRYSKLQLSSSSFSGRLLSKRRKDSTNSNPLINEESNVANEKTSFAGVKFPRPLSTALNRLNIINTPSPIQKTGIPALCSGLSCILHAATGTGKTYTYLLPALKRLFENPNQLSKPLQILIIVPTRELVEQITEDIRKLTDYQYPNLVFNCKIDQTEEQLQFKDQSPIWIGTSFKINDFIEKKLVGNLFRNIEYIVFDEVDRLIYAPSKYATVQERKDHRNDEKDRPTRNIINHLLKSKVVLSEDGQYRLEEFQVVGASATVGRPVRRELYHLFNVQEINDVKDDKIRKYDGNFAVIRPEVSATVDKAESEIPYDLQNWKFQEEGSIAEDDEEEADYDESISDEAEPKKKKGVRSTESNRMVSIPSSIQHLLLIDPEDDAEYEEQAKKKRELEKASALSGKQNTRSNFRGKSANQRNTKEEDEDQNETPFRLPRKLSLIHREYLLKDSQWSKVLIFVPKPEDVVQAMFVLKKWKTGNVTSLSTTFERLENSPSEMVASTNLETFLTTNLSRNENIVTKNNREIIVVPFSGTRGLHIPNVDTVFIVKPPRTMDEYLHIAGRTGRLNCGENDWLPIEDRGLAASNKEQTSKVITVTSFRDYRRISSWQVPLNIQFQWLTS